MLPEILFYSGTIDKRNFRFLFPFAKAWPESQAFCFSGLSIYTSDFPLSDWEKNAPYLYLPAVFSP